MHKLRVHNPDPMKNIATLPVLLVTILCSCSGSDKYQGKWKAMDLKSHKYEIVFSPNSFSVQDTTGKLTNFSYTQNSYYSANSIETYSIQLEDGRGYQIHFPRANDESVALIKDENGVSVYMISRKDYQTYEDIYKLN